MRRFKEHLARRFELRNVNVNVTLVRETAALHNLFTDFFKFFGMHFLNRRA